MGRSLFKNIVVSGISACVPHETVKNIDYSDLFSDKEKRKIIKTVGIKERRIAPKDITASDLGFKAASNLLSEMKIDRNDIKGLIFLSQTPDYKIPFTSNILQERLALPHDCTCMDINAGCSGFITGLQTAFSISQGLESGKVLFIVAETMSRIISNKDKATSLLFADGAAALLIEKTDKVSTSFFTSCSDGSHADAIMIKDGGSRYPFTDSSLEKKEFEDGSERSDLDLKMNGADVFDFTMRNVAPSVLEMQEFSKKKVSDIDNYVFHQANLFITKQLAMELTIPKEKLVINIDRFGNTSGVSIPLAIITELGNKGEVTDYVHCTGFGAGLSWGNTIFSIKNTKLLPLIEL